ncbi:MAG: thymidine phosphorylase, partial [Bdellovibrionaceae bacterium]|nr:thymidine phosphorylase [Pseudobdellovibrionaceae bacterium]
TTAFITDMNQPLGRFIGNTIEVLECISLFKNTPVLNHEPSAFADTLELSLQLSAEMLVLSGHSATFESALTAAGQTLTDGSAFLKFEEMVRRQGGSLENYELPPTLQWKTVCANSPGFVSEINGETVGYAAIALGAGRKTTADSIDHSASIIIHKKLGDVVRTGEPIFSFACKNLNAYSEAEKALSTSFGISSDKPHPQKLILKKINAFDAKA